jgi:hypothetical protein
VAIYRQPRQVPLPSLSLAGVLLALGLAGVVSAVVGLTVWSLAAGQGPSAAAQARLRTHAYQAGYAKGVRAGRLHGRRAGYRAGLRAGKRRGHRAGYRAGVRAGERRGRTAGYAAGEAAGYRSGYAAGRRARPTKP